VPDFTDGSLLSFVFHSPLDPILWYIYTLCEKR
jgi:hypothetical protein